MSGLLFLPKRWWLLYEPSSSGLMMAPLFEVDTRKSLKDRSDFSKLIQKKMTNKSAHLLLCSWRHLVRMLTKGSLSIHNCLISIHLFPLVRRQSIHGLCLLNGIGGAIHSASRVIVVVPELFVDLEVLVLLHGVS